MKQSVAKVPLIPLPVLACSDTMAMWLVALKGPSVCPSLRTYQFSLTLCLSQDKFSLQNTPIFPYPDALSYNFTLVKCSIEVAAICEFKSSMSCMVPLLEA
jgi:hypothetical protein